MMESGKYNKTAKHPVRIVREELKMTQDSFGERLGVTDKYISQIETEKKHVSLRMAKKIAAIAKYPTRIDWLMGESNHRSDAEVTYHEMEGMDASFRSAWILLDDALQTRAQTLSYHPNPKLTPDDDNMPIYSLPAFGDFVIEDRATHELIFKMPQNRMYKLQRELTRYAGFLIDGMMQKGGYNDGEH